MTNFGAKYYGVSLEDQAVGFLSAHDDYVSFRFFDEYREDPDRGVLGLRFEEDLAKAHNRSLLLPPWFSNLLPEGALREWIARDAGVSPQREMPLLAHVGHDLPGAVRVFETDGPADFDAVQEEVAEQHVPSTPDQEWRFSLAGVALKFSLVSKEDKFVAPATGEGGDWIVKLPDGRFADVPTNEYAAMSFARALGLDVPETRLVHREEIDGLPAAVWPSNEEYAYAVRRFDRLENRRPVHIEDMAQVLGKDVRDKYQGNYESIASVVYRSGADEAGLVEFCKRLAFLVLLSSGDAHHKNWSLIYRDRRRPTLSPAYDLVATSHYYAQNEQPDKLALKFLGNRRFEMVRTHHFAELEQRLGVSDGLLTGPVRELIGNAQATWEAMPMRDALPPAIRDSVDHSISSRAGTLKG